MTTVPLPRELSPTSIDRWRVCPRRFLFQDVQKVPFKEAPTFEQILGNTLHRVLEALFRLEPTKRTQEVVKKLTDLNVARFSTRAALRDDDAERLRDEATGQLTQFTDSTDLTAVRLRLEYPFQLRLSNGTTIKTYVDRLDRAQSGMLEIIDYKTGRNELEDRDLGYETAPIVQLHAIGKASDEPVEKVTWHYLRSGNTVSWWPEADDVDAATDRLLDVLRRLHAEAEYEPNPGAQCAYCPFSAICPAWPGDACEE